MNLISSAKNEVGFIVILPLLKWRPGFHKGQSLVTKLIVALGYKLTQYLFIGGEF